VIELSEIEEIQYFSEFSFANIRILIGLAKAIPGPLGVPPPGKPGVAPPTPKKERYPDPPTNFFKSMIPPPPVRA